jgi:hypothetical protein
MKLSVLMFTMCFFVIGNQVKSQDAQTKSTLPTKFMKGWGTELNFNPFDGSLSLNNGSGQIKIRRFCKNDIALRSAVAVTYKSENSITNMEYTQIPYESSSSKKSLLMSINLGIEKHFNTNSRLSPYVGLELGIGFKKSKQEFTHNDSYQTINGAWYSNFEYNGSYYSAEIEERGYWSPNMNVFTGFDYYIANNFYIGYELGFGLEYFNYVNVEITQDIDYPTQLTLPENELKTWNIGPRLLNGIRIGYNF